MYVFSLGPFPDPRGPLSLSDLLRVLAHSLTSNHCIPPPHLFADGVQGVGAAASVAQLHVQGVVEQGQAAAGLQDPVGLLEEAGAVEPVKGAHGRHQIHRATG